jgi:hypothetical protein
MNVAEAEGRRGATQKFAYASGSRPLEGYTIKRGVGRGGFGEVYYATSDGGKEVALKLIRRNLDVELRGVQHCLNLKHPHLVGLFDIRHDEHEDAWVVMEFVRGESLEDVIQRHPTGMPEELALWWFQGMASGVGYLHEQGIVHRDVKPGNIFNDEGVVKIGDYGLSKFISASRRSGQTESVGTVHYMAPEIANGRYGKEIDIYALGVVLYEMLTGHVPFEGESVGEVLMKHLTAQPDLNKVPQRYRAAIARALTKDPQQRFSSVGELLSAVGLSATAAGQFVSASGNGAAVANGAGNMPPRRAPLVTPAAAFIPAAGATVRSSFDAGNEEPIAAALRQGLAKFRSAWQQANFPKPVKVILIVLAVIVGVHTLPFWILPVALLCLLYLVYFAIRALVMPSPLSTSRPLELHAQPPPIHPVPPPSVVQSLPPAATVEAPPVRRAERLRRERRPVLPAKSARERLTELLGSLLLSTAVATAMAVVLTLIVAGNVQVGEVCWLAGVGTLGAWGVLIPSKFWEGTVGEPILRRFVLLCVGLALGFVALGLDEALVVDLLPIRELDPRAHVQISLVAKEALFLAYFTFLMPVLRWWRQADPLRGSRFSFWSTGICIGWAAVLSLAWPFPQPWGMMAAATIAVSVQLAAPWFDWRALRVRPIEGVKK